ncbi:polymorphic toxin-type HINT domain-containing protein [Kitasatospora sp. NPDC058201]|uniref:polymorphic toxin-type HINT domain-containing protein n=1 Tax=unclassified Kitasatospora TaxID=2633591 RepID=UPI00365BA0C4
MSAQVSTAGTVTSTAHHRYWSESAHSWRDATDLAVGDTVRTTDGQAVRITAVRNWTSLQPAYNLTVSTIHTYYVFAGLTAILVHNDEDPNCGLDLAKLVIDDKHIWEGHTPEGTNPDVLKTEYLAGTDKNSRAAFIRTVLSKGKQVFDTPNRDGEAWEHTFLNGEGKPMVIGKTRNADPNKVKDLYTIRAYVNPDTLAIRNAFPVDRP